MRQIHCLLIGLTGVAMLVSTAQAQAADDPEIAVEISATEVFTGESVDYIVDVRNVQNPSAPDLTALRRDFDVVATGDESHNQLSQIHHQRQSHPGASLRSHLPFSPDAQADRADSRFRHRR